MALLRSKAEASIADICVWNAAPDHAVEYVKELDSEFRLYAVTEEELLGQGDVLVVGRG